MEFNAPLFSTILDYELIVSEYDKHWDFHDDFFNLPYTIFYLRIGGLENFSQIVNLRKRFLNGEKLNKDESKRARKLLNEEQLIFQEQYEQEKLEKELLSTFDKFKNIALKNSKKNKGGG